MSTAPGPVPAVSLSATTPRAPTSEDDSADEFDRELWAEIEKLDKPPAMKDADMLKKLQEVKDDAKQHGIDMSDLIVKLSFMSGFDGVDSKASADFNYVLCKMILTVAVGGGDDDKEDAQIFQVFVESVHSVLKRAVACDTSVPLTCAGVDVLRTAYYWRGSSHANGALWEYGRADRDGGGLYKGMDNALRSHDSHEITPLQEHAHYVGSNMMEMMDGGLERLEKLATMPQEEIIDLLKSECTVGVEQVGIQGCPHHVSGAFISMAIPAMFDGQRLRAGVEIASKVFGSEGVTYGGGIVEKIFNSSGSIGTLARVQATCVTFISMARKALEDQFVATAEESGGDKEDAQRAARKSGDWAATNALMASVYKALWDKKNAEKDNKTDSPGGISSALGSVADWFDDALTNETGTLFRIVKSIFEAQVFEIGNVTPQIQKMWDIFCKLRERETFNFWEVVDFVSEAMHNMSQSCMTVSSVMNVVLGGAVGHLMDPGCIDGPIVFATGFIEQVAAMTSLHFPKRVFVAEKTKEKGKKARDTKVLKAISKTGRVRGQHEKGKLSEARLRACFVMISMQESLLRILPEGSCALPGENRKDIRRLYMCFLQSLPCVKSHRIRHTDEKGSFLIERCNARKRKSDEETDPGKTTRDNVEKPWRDVVGGAMVSTLFHGIVGEAYIATVKELMDPGKFESTTTACVGMVVEKLKDLSEKTYFTQAALPEDKRVLNYNEASLMLKQQAEFFGNFCKLVKNQGKIWECLALTYSVQAAPESDEDPYSVQAAPESDEDLWE